MHQRFWSKDSSGGQLSLLAANKHIHGLGKAGLLREYLIRSPNSMAVVINDVDPNDLRFTQLSISPAFKPPYQGLFLKDAIAKIKRKDMKVSTFPMPFVIKHENTLWCLNNRRLFVFRKAKVEKIDVQISRCPMHPRLSVVLENPGHKKKMMEKKYFPYVVKYRPGQGVHTNPPPMGYPAVPSQAGNCPPTSIHHRDPKFNAVVGQPGQHHPCRYPTQYLHKYFVPNSMQVAWLHAHYCGPEARCILPNATKLQGSAATISTPVAKVQEDHEVQIDPARNPEVGVCAPPPPIFNSPRLASTPKCSPSQVPSGPIVCVYNKKERLAPPITTASMKPNACRDPKPASPRQDLKGKLAVVEEKASSQLPSKIPSAAGPTMSSERPPSATRRVPGLATGFRKPKPDSISQGMGNPEAPPKQPQQVPKVKIHASTELPDHHLIYLYTIPNESCKFPGAATAAAGPILSSERSQSETRMDPRLANGLWKPKPDSISQGMQNPEAPPKQPKQVPRAKIHASTELPDHHLINVDTIPNESCKFPAAAAAGPTMTSERPQPETRMEPRLATGVGKLKPDSISQGMGNPGAPPNQPNQVPKVTDASMDLLDWQPINLETIPNEELPDKRMNARIFPKPIEILGISITPADRHNERYVESSEGDSFLRHVSVRDTPRIWGFVFNLVKKLCPPSASV